MLFLVSVGIRSFMLKDNQGGNYIHFALAGGAVMLVHIQNRFKKDFQVFVIESGFSGKIGTDKAAHLIQPEGD